MERVGLVEAALGRVDRRRAGGRARREAHGPLQDRAARHRVAHDLDIRDHRTLAGRHCRHDVHPPARGVHGGRDGGVALEIAGACEAGFDASRGRLGECGGVDGARVDARPFHDARLIDGSGADDEDGRDPMQRPFGDRHRQAGRRAVHHHLARRDPRRVVATAPVELRQRRAEDRRVAPCRALEFAPLDLALEFGGRDRSISVERDAAVLDPRSRNNRDRDRLLTRAVVAPPRAVDLRREESLVDHRPARPLAQVRHEQPIVHGLAPRLREALNDVTGKFIARDDEIRPGPAPHLVLERDDSRRAVLRLPSRGHLRLEVPGVAQPVLDALAVVLPLEEVEPVAGAELGVLQQVLPGLRAREGHPRDRWLLFLRRAGRRRGSRAWGPAEHHLVAHFHRRADRVTGDVADLDPSERADGDHPGQAALAQVLREQQVDLLADLLADRQARFGVNVGADQVEFQLAHPHGVEANGRTGQSEDVARDAGHDGVL